MVCFTVTMNYTQKIISEYFKDKEHRFISWGEDDSIVLDEEYFAMDYLSLFISLSGSIDLSTDWQTWRPTSEDLQFFAFEKMIRISNISKDYRSVGLLFSRECWADVLIKYFPSLAMSWIFPVIPISSQTKSVLLDFIRQIQIYKKEGRADSDALVVNTVMGLLYHVEKACKTIFSDMSGGGHSNLVVAFVRLLFKHYREHREVEFYAEKLNLSASHFSALIKQMTGKTVGSCIKQYIAIKACAELKNSDKSIKEIAMDLNFSDVSYFCKFFKKNMGKSPEEFRQFRKNKY